MDISLQCINFCFNFQLDVHRTIYIVLHNRSIIQNNQATKLAKRSCGIWGISFYGQNKTKKMLLLTGSDV
jgi:hypothetical protein